MIIDHRQLSREALTGVIEEYVTRDGTEHTDSSVKAATVRDRLDNGGLFLVYDSELDSCNILSVDQLPAGNTDD